MNVFLSEYLYRSLYVVHNCKTNFLRDNKEYYYYYYYYNVNTKSAFSLYDLQKPGLPSICFYDVMTLARYTGIHVLCDRVKSLTREYAGPRMGNRE